MFIPKNSFVTDLQEKLEKNRDGSLLSSYTDELTKNFLYEETPNFTNEICLNGIKKAKEIIKEIKIYIWQVSNEIQRLTNRKELENNEKNVKEIEQDTKTLKNNKDELEDMIREVNWDIRVIMEQARENNQININSLEEKWKEFLNIAKNYSYL